MNDDLNTNFYNICDKNCNCHKSISIFEHSQFSLLLEDMYEFKLKIDALKNEIGIKNIRERLNDMNLLKSLAKSIKLIKINNKLLELYGAKSKNDLDYFFDTFTEDSINTFKEEIVAIANGQKTFKHETRVKKINGELVDIIINIDFPDETKDFNNVIVSLTDITYIKKLEKEIAKSNEALKNNLEKFKDILETNKIAYVILDRNGTIKETSNVFVKIIGCKKPEDLVGITIQNLISKDHYEKITKALNKIDNGTPIEDMEVCIDNSLFEKNGIWIRLCANSLENGNKKIVCVVKDITFKKIEELKKYITNEKSKDKIKQNITRIRSQLNVMKEWE